MSNKFFVSIFLIAIALVGVSSFINNELTGSVVKFLAIVGVLGLIAGLQAGRYEAKENGKGYRNGALSDVLNWFSIALTFFCLGAVGSYIYDRNSIWYNLIIGSIGITATITTFKITNYAYKVIGTGIDTETEQNNIKG
jgi:hypothetical protein